VAESTLRARRPESIAPPASGEQARALPLRELTDAFTTYGADLDLACGTLRQCSEELQVLLQAKQSGCSDALIDSVLLGIAQRMMVAAKLSCEESEW
jgi:hypothetical protein